MKTILAVDDSPSMRKLLSSALGQRGDRVIEAGDGADALTKLSADSVHLIITDLNMPVMGGVEFIRHVRERRESQAIPILILTTDAQSEERRAAKAAGASGWIVKPFTRTQLTAVIDRIFGVETPVRISRPDPRELFRHEADELLIRMEKIAYELGQRPDDVEAIDRMVRVFHTLKGTGAMFGFVRASEFACHFEKFMRRVREDGRIVDDSLLALVLEARAPIRTLLEEPENILVEPECRRIIGALDQSNRDGSRASPTTLHSRALGSPRR